MLVLAEAGYGKTTLLADSRGGRAFEPCGTASTRTTVTGSRHAHLVAAGREHDPDFAPRTAGLLADTGVAGPAPRRVLDAYLRELPQSPSTAWS